MSLEGQELRDRSQRMLADYRALCEAERRNLAGAIF